MVVLLSLRGERVEQAFRPAVCCIIGSAASAAEVRPSGAEARHLSCLNAGLKLCSTQFSRSFRLFMRWLLSAGAAFNEDELVAADLTSHVLEPAEVEAAT